MVELIVTLAGIYVIGIACTCALFFADKVWKDLKGESSLSIAITVILFIGVWPVTWYMFLRWLLRGGKW